ncbi:FAD/NAD(P)-binding domain-containing protein [Rhodocollybia butyracea]|uniref:FAD/NAD(P)-binding domain-containing protein n=1 Tax=Rhodocollybia butyracea TaxID=206335 RepID=A0A9P5UGM5_9AGAR|nr:FAD/NAD(P)-binding domain-containing protein [Rhodocollybia butyracea]
MYLQTIFLLSLLAVASGVQEPLYYNEHSSSYQFKWPIRKVAIVGAGAGGLVAYRELTQLGFEVRIFERDSVPGGNWHYTDETPLHAPVPNLDISEADFRPHLPPDDIQLPYEQTFDDLEPKVVEELRRDHRAPTPIWSSLTSTGPKFRALPWPDYIPLTLTHNHVQRYIRTFASLHGVNSNDGSLNASYNTRVERVDKRYNTEGEAVGWTVTLRQFIQTKERLRLTHLKQDFDAVVLASGRSNAPNAPDIPGLAQWDELYPQRVTHSREYRHRNEFVNQTVLIIGGSVSGAGIAEDISGTANKVFLSIRTKKDDSPLSEVRKMHLSRVPKNVSIVPEIRSFHELPRLTSNDDLGMRSGVIELANGTLLQGFDRIILATGFRYTLPFFPQYQNSSLRANETIPVGSGQPQPLLTDGTHIRSLHMDLFYIEEPTLGFINFNLNVDAFLYSEFAAVVIGKVWAGEAKLPSAQHMWNLHWQRLKDAGGKYGRNLVTLNMEKQAEMIRYIVGWLNHDALSYGGRLIDGPAEE